MSIAAGWRPRVSAAVLDIAEVSHQLDEDQGSLGALAATIAVLHATTAALAVWHTTDRPPTTRTA